MYKEKIKWFWEILKESYAELQQNDPLRLSSSTAFFAIFSIIPIIMLLLNLLGIILSKEYLTEEIFGTLQKMFGEEATTYLSTILENVQEIEQGPLVTIGILIFLIFVATTFFQIVQKSFNQIWKVKPKEDAGLKFILGNRLLSLGIIVFGGILFLASFLTTIAVQFMGNNLQQFIGINLEIAKIFNIVFSLAIITIGFAIVFKYLPDISLPWKPVWFGSIITSILFILGQYIIGKVILSGNLSSIYGASASMVLLLLFIFYLSFILYFGFCLVKKYADKENYSVSTSEWAVQYEVNTLE